MRDDLAARRRNNQILEQANATLEARVRERTAELVKSNSELKEENLERRWSHEALEHQLRYSQLIVNSVDELVFVVSRALNISRINPAVSRVTQWEPQELIAQSLRRALQLTAGERPPPRNRTRSPSPCARPARFMTTTRSCWPGPDNPSRCVTACFPCATRTKSSAPSSPCACATDATTAV